MKHNQKNILNKERLAIAFSMIALLLFVLLCPQEAYAATAASDDVFSFSGIIGKLQFVVSTFLLPIAIVWVTWKFLYLAVVVGMMGFDPLRMLGSTSKVESYETVKGAIRDQAIYFVKGICWIGGIFIIFQLVVILASTIAGVFGTAFGGK